MKIRFYSLILLAFATLAFTGIRSNGPGEYVGHWAGSADGQTNFTLDISIEDEELVAVLNVADQGLTDLTSNWSDFGGEHELKLMFTMPDEVLLTMDGQLSEEGKFIGSYEFGEQAGSFTMTKKAEDEG